VLTPCHPLLRTTSAGPGSSSYPFRKEEDKEPANRVAEDVEREPVRRRAAWRTTTKG
jgi:hypothetical protein